MCVCLPNSEVVAAVIRAAIYSLSDICLLSIKKLSRYSMMSATTPAPTVRPPSRIAKRSSFSIAIGWINSTVIVMLSPGITISTPVGRSAVPVTSVVRK